MTSSATNAAEYRTAADDIQTARALYVLDLLRSERWSIRQAALRIGVNASVLASRMKGETAFLATEIEQLAPLVRKTPVELYAEYLSVGPAGFEPTTSTVEVPRLIPFPARAEDAAEVSSPSPVVTLASRRGGAVA